MAEVVRAVGEHVVSWGVRSGRYPIERMSYWNEAYMADPVGTTRLIESLTPILAAPGYQRLLAAAARADVLAAAGDDSVDPEFASLFPPASESVSAVPAVPVAASTAVDDTDLSDAELRAAGLLPPTWDEIDAAQRASDARISLLSDEELEAELFGPEN